jgi:hypothetical protein
MNGRYRVAGALLGAIVAGLTAVPANSQSGIAGPMPGIVIVDPAAGAPSSRGRAIARQLAGAGYATVVVASNPVTAAASLRRQPNVRSDDIGIIGYGPARPRCSRRSPNATISTSRSHPSSVQPWPSIPIAHARTAIGSGIR